MSADNGIYILKLKDEARIIHAQAIENVYWNYTNSDEDSSLNFAELYWYFQHATITNHEEMYNVAHNMSKGIYVLEYGVSVLEELDMTWEEVFQKAKEKAIIELHELNTNPKWDNRWDDMRGDLSFLIEQKEI